MTNDHNDIEVTAACECPFRYKTDGVSSDAGSYFPGDEMCSVLADLYEECHGFMNKGCPLLNGPILVSGKEVQ